VSRSLALPGGGAGFRRAGCFATAKQSEARDPVYSIQALAAAIGLSGYDFGGGGGTETETLGVL
jgi:hypothetical protein